MCYITVKIENNRFKNPLARLKRKNLDKYFGTLAKRRANTNDDDHNRCLLLKYQENCSFDVADVEVNDFIEFEFHYEYRGFIHRFVVYVRVHSITDKEICFDTYNNKISWKSHQDQQYF